jgi:hypothetical protein
MKKLITSSLAITFILLLFASCGSSKGCGLTSDASEIQNTTSTIAQTEIIAEAK